MRVACGSREWEPDLNTKDTKERQEGTKMPWLGKAENVEIPRNDNLRGGANGDCQAREPDPNTEGTEEE